MRSASAASAAALQPASARTAAVRVLVACAVAYRRIAICWRRCELTRQWCSARMRRLMELLRALSVWRPWALLPLVDAAVLAVSTAMRSRDAVSHHREQAFAHDRPRCALCAPPSVRRVSVWLWACP